VVREALDALYWSRMAEASRRLSPEHREEYQRESALWERAVATDATRNEK